MPHESVAATLRFPELDVRDLQGRDLRTPTCFTGERNVVVIAFDRHHQALVDTWVPWLESRAREDPGLRFYELPAIARRWAPARRLIDGGMAAAIRVPEVLERTLTYYGPLRALCGPLRIADRATITVVVVAAGGEVLGAWEGPHTDTGERTLAALVAAAP